MKEQCMERHVDWERAHFGIRLTCSLFLLVCEVKEGVVECEILGSVRLITLFRRGTRIQESASVQD